MNVFSSAYGFSEMHKLQTWPTISETSGDIYNIDKSVVAVELLANINDKASHHTDFPNPVGKHTKISLPTYCVDFAPICLIVINKFRILLPFL